MSKTLNITNGDCAVEVMEKAGISGDFLPWRDVLHEGPVPAGISLQALSKVRANFIASQGWADAEQVQLSFIERDNTLLSFERYEKVVLWFEHDLYDQLQILQILDWFYQNRPSTTALSMICVDQYLGTLKPTEMTALRQYEVPISEHQYVLSSKAWSAFCADSPDRWQALLKTDTTALPFLEGAVFRMLEEYPSCANGLSRTAHQALKIIAGGETKPAKIFGLYQQSEQRRFLGDTSFGAILEQFLNSSPPLIIRSINQPLIFQTKSAQKLTITQKGRAVLLGQSHWLEVAPIDRWIGGVYLTSENRWCWDVEGRTIVGGNAHA